MKSDDLRTRLFVSVRELAEIADLDERTVRRGIAAGEIPALRVSTTTRIPARWVLEQAHAINPEDSEASPATGLAVATATDPNALESADAIVGPGLRAVNQSS